MPQQTKMAMLKHFVVFSILVVCSLAQDKPRLNCVLNENNFYNDDCRKRECIWQEGEDQEHLPRCYLDVTKIGYSLEGTPTKRSNGLEANLVANSAYKKQIHFPQIEKLKLDVNYLSENILRIRITDPANKRYEVPVVSSEFNIPNSNPSSTKYDVELKEKFDLIVTRKETGAKIIDTSIGGLIFGDKFLQFATYVASSDVYGIGENYQLSFKHKMHYETYPLFARDRAMSQRERNNYGVHPFYTVVEKDGKANGVLLVNSNAMAFTMMPAPAVSIKTTGGILDFLIFVGDNPEHVVKLYTSVIGRPVMPPFWSLGFQLCRYGYSSLDHVKKVVKRNLDNHVPIDVKYLDIDYMDEHRDFTYDHNKFNDLPEYIRETKEKHGMKWTLILDPAIEGDKPGYTAFDEGYKRDVFIKWPDSIPPEKRSKPGKAPTDKGVMYGHVWPPGPAAFPDFFKNVTKEWWIDMLKEMHKTLEYDSIWIDMNEPANFGSDFLHCPQNEFEISLPSQNLDPLNAATLCMSAVQGEKGELRHYDVHSLFGWSQTKPTYQGVQAATGKRGFVVTRSTYPSSGKYSAHWLGDNFSQFEQMKQSIVGMLQFSLFGISFTGADICGFIGNTNPQMCRRWLQLGAFYPFSRSHNNAGSPDQDPGYWVENGHPEVTKAAVASLRTRYQLLHYLYTRFYLSHQTGETLARPMHHEFPQDANARNIDQQFFLGPAILVNPFLEENKDTVDAYVPAGSEWFRLSHDFVEKATITNGHVHFADADSDKPLLFRAGSIIPVVGERNLPKFLNTANLRQVPIDLWILPTASNGSAYGDLFYDDGESIDSIEKGNYNYYQFKLDKCQLTIEVAHSGAQAGSRDILKVDTINVALHSVASDVHVTLDGNQVKSTVTGNTLKIESNLDLLQSKKSVSISIKGKSNECFLH